MAGASCAAIGCVRRLLRIGEIENCSILIARLQRSKIPWSCWFLAFSFLIYIPAPHCPDQALGMDDAAWVWMRGAELRENRDCLFHAIHQAPSPLSACFPERSALVAGAPPAV